MVEVLLLGKGVEQPPQFHRASNAAPRRLTASPSTLPHEAKVLLEHKGGKEGTVITFPAAITFHYWQAGSVPPNTAPSAGRP